MERGERIRGEIVFAALYLPGLAQFFNLLRNGRVNPPGGRSLRSLRLELEHDCFVHGERPVNRKRWPAVERVLRQQNWGLGQISNGLRKHGFVEEASRLETPGMQTLATLVVEGGFCLTPWHGGYPRAWLERLGALAPPAIWCGCFNQGQSSFDGNFEAESGSGNHVLLRGGSEEWIAPTAGMAAIVGARDAGARHLERVAVLARVMARAGWGLCSGGAVGVDFAAISAYELAGGLKAVEIVPYGLWSEGFWGQINVCRSFFGKTKTAQEITCEVRGRIGLEGDTGDVRNNAPKIFLSLMPPFGTFNVRAAMERNALIYAGADHTVVVSPKYKTGGTWHGACDALRRRLSPVILAREDSVSTRALMGLGAVEMPLYSDEQQMRSAWEAARASSHRGYGQPGLFGGCEVRDQPVGYEVAR